MRAPVLSMRKETNTVQQIEVGMDAPDFSLMGTTGQRFTLSDTRGLKRTLLIFYPADMTAG